ncbi:hypothetical protein OG730_09920 [Streptomyces sp. NBC_01298]|uniref:hypothetical protein n=1 Tax=Streptomyces sp. NBC_01298 TaxID=2903817 RepID=UPI002E0E2747|nr:hypothetical protein OG730_09920 [Streptomyces sp. NBC_01298]
MAGDQQELEEGEEFALVARDGGPPCFVPLRLDGPVDELYDLTVQEAAERMGVPAEHIRGPYSIYP